MEQIWSDVLREVALEGPWGCTLTELWELIHFAPRLTVRVKEVIFRKLVYSKGEIEFIYLYDRCVEANPLLNSF